jgi:branched-chain amino acid transport system permease protein
VLAWAAGPIGPIATGLLAPLREVLFGLLIVVFLIAEPRGLYGIWSRVRDWRPNVVTRRSRK